MASKLTYSDIIQDDGTLDHVISKLETIQHKVNQVKEVIEKSINPFDIETAKKVREIVTNLEQAVINSLK